MSDVVPVTTCPQCGSHAIDYAAFTKAELHDVLICPDCKGRFRKDQFTAKLVGKAAEIIKNTLRNIPGIKFK